MTTTTSTGSGTGTTTRLAPSMVGGALGGVAGGMVFGMLMQMMNVMPMIAQLVGSQSIAVAWVVHLTISAGLGATFGVLVARRHLGVGSLTGLGVAYGVLWWVVGALLVMPAKLGMPVLHLDTMAWQSLMGHMMFGAILGIVTGAWLRRASQTHA